MVAPDAHEPVNLGSNPRSGNAKFYRLNAITFFLSLLKKLIFLSFLNFLCTLEYS